MSEPVDPLAEETIARIFILRRPLEGIPVFFDIAAHEGLLVQSESGKYRIYERGKPTCGFTDVPSPVSGENVWPKITFLGKQTQSYKVGNRKFDKQIHGQKVEKTVTFGDLNNFSADKRFNEGYHAANNNCQDYQEKVRSELLNLSVDRSLRTEVTKIVFKLVSPPGYASYQASLTTRGAFTKISDSDSSHGTDLPTLPSSHDISGHERVSKTFSMNESTRFDDIIDGALPSLFAETPSLNTYNASLLSFSSSSFDEFQAQANARTESEARRRVDQFQTHAPGILGAAENVVNCFSQGQYFAGVWNTGAIAWSCAVLYGTGGAVSVTIEAPPNLDGPPRVQLAVAGLLSFGGRTSAK